MRTIYKSTCERMDAEVRAAIHHACELVEGKDGFRTCTGETWRNCHLEIQHGHNIYTTNIYLKPDEKAVQRRPDAFNTYAFYANGAFWACISLNKVDLI